MGAPPPHFLFPLSRVKLFLQLLWVCQEHLRGVLPRSLKTITPIRRVISNLILKSKWSLCQLIEIFLCQLFHAQEENCWQMQKHS